MSRKFFDDMNANHGYSWLSTQEKSVVGFVSYQSHYGYDIGLIIKAHFSSVNAGIVSYYSCTASFIEYFKMKLM